MVRNRTYVRLERHVIEQGENGENVRPRANDSRPEDQNYVPMIGAERVPGLRRAVREMLRCG